MIRPALLVPLLVFGPAAGVLAQTTTYRWVDERGQVNFSDQPPPPSVRILEIKRVATAGQNPDRPLSYALGKLATDFPVVLYTSDNCGEPCDAARALLSTRGIPFTESKIATEEGLADYRQRFGAPETVPTVSVGTTPYKGFERGEWSRMLDNVGYPKAPSAAGR